MAAGALSLWLLTLCAGAGAAVRPSSRAAHRGIAHGAVTGRIAGLSGYSLTIQTHGRRTGIVNALMIAASRVTKQDYPYVYGGGHAQAGMASVGIPGPGYNGHRKGYDCSGAVAAVLVGGGLWQAGSGVPADNGIITELRSQRLIVKGAGRGPVEVTLYDDPGVHIFMSIDGRFFGTSDGGGGGNRRGGAGWLNDGAPDATSSRYRRYHFRASALRGSVSSGHEVTFSLGTLAGLADQLRNGERLRVSYTERQSGEFMATAIAPPNGHTASGTVTSIATDGSTFTLQKSGGSVMTFSTAQDPGAVAGLWSGATVQVSYTRHGSTLNARLITIPGGSAWPGSARWGR